MNKNQYKLRILPLFEEDLNEIVDYISLELDNPTAAGKLVDDIEAAIINRLPYAESFEQYKSIKDRKYPYYRIHVKNFTIYYVVIDTIMEIRRIIYNRRDFKKLI